MSIILKGIDLPKDKDCINLSIYSNGDVYEQMDNGFYIIINAEAIQIPKDHGKIADITKYKKENAMQDDTCEGCPNEAKCIYYTYTKEDICEWLDGIPTILEAEE